LAAHNLFPKVRAGDLIGVSALCAQRELLLAWTSRTVRARYEQSLLGVLWAVIQPIATVIIFSIVFTRFVPVDTGRAPYVLFSFTALVPWTLVSTSLTDMVGSLVGNLNLVTKIYFPREVLPIAAFLARMLDFGIASIVLVALIVLYGLPAPNAAWLYLPVVLAIQIALVVGLGLVCAALNIFYRDVRHIVMLGLQIWLYASPVIYPASLVPEQLRTLYFLNPMAGIIEAYRAILLNAKQPDATLVSSAVMSVGILALGSWFFRHVEPYFADVI
jgi:lipopolysaccharide transport system permease protein